jgi:glucose/arabinose dehydrogenase
VILKIEEPFSNHNGGMIGFGPDGMLYIGVGDGGSGGDPDGNGQNPGTLLGSVLRINPQLARQGDSYTVPETNPFVGSAEGLPEIWAYGLRNPWRFSFDSATGDLWLADVGQQLREEVYLVVRGATTAGIGLKAAAVSRRDVTATIAAPSHRWRSTTIRLAARSQADTCNEASRPTG